MNTEQENSSDKEEEFIGNLENIQESQKTEFGINEDYLEIDDELENEDDDRSMAEKIIEKADETMSTKYFRLLLVTIILFIIGFLSRNKQISIIDSSENEEIMNAGSFINHLGLVNLVYLSLSFLLFHVSYFCVKRFEIFNLGFYYINEISDVISLGFITLFYIIKLFLTKNNYYLRNKQGLSVSVNDVLNILLIATIIFGIIKLWAKSVAISFNYSIYIERIRKCLLEDVCISILEISMKGKETNDGKSIFKYLPRPSYIKKHISNEYIIRKFCNDEELDLVKRRILLTEFQDNFKSSKLKFDINRERVRFEKLCCKVADRIVFKGNFGPKTKYIQDVTVFFREKKMGEELLKKMNVTRKYKLDKQNLPKYIEKVYKEKYILYKNIDQMNSAIDRVSFCMKLLTGFLCLLLLYIRASNQSEYTISVITAVFGTQLISNSFSANVINSLIFLFIIHPYDIGDRIFVNIDNHMENLVVAELNVFSTVFYGWDGKCIYIPNSILANKMICNIRRSGILAESHKIQINSKTDQTKIIALKSSIETFLKKHPEHFTDYCMVNYDFIENSNKLHMKCYMQYKTNWQNYELYLERKTLFLSFLNRCLESLEIDYCLPPQRVIIKSNK